MAQVREWFPEFAISVVDRSGREDFPAPGSEFWRDFERSLERHAATWELAEEALSIVLDTPDLYPNQIRPLVIETMKRLQALPGAADALGALEAARVASASCPECSGSGRVSVFVHDDIAGLFAAKNGEPVPVGYSVSIACVCPLGRRDGPQHPEIVSSPKYRHSPRNWDDDMGVPVAPRSGPIAASDVKHLKIAGKPPGRLPGESFERRRRDQLSRLPRPTAATHGDPGGMPSPSPDTTQSPRPEESP